MKLSTILKLAAVATVGYVGYKLLTGEELELEEAAAVDVPELPQLTDVTPEAEPVITLPEEPAE